MPFAVYRQSGDMLETALSNQQPGNRWLQTRRHCNPSADWYMLLDDLGFAKWLAV